MHNFEQMEELAKDGSSEGRGELLRMLTDLFLENFEQGSEEHAEAFADIVTRVLDDLVEDTRLDFSKRVSAVDHFPEEVVKKLAWDTFEVASPVLEHSTVISDEDLVQVAQKQSDDHLMAISRRSELKAVVTDVLVVRGSAGVVHSVAANPGATFSKKGYDKLADKAKDDKKLQTTIVARADVTSEIATKLEPFLNALLKKRLDKKLVGNPGDVTGLVAKAKQRVEKALVGKKRDLADAEVALQKISDGETTLDEVVANFADARRPVPLSTVLAGVAELPEKMVSNALLKVNGLPSAVTCCALGLEPKTFAKIAKMRCSILRLPESSGERLAIQFTELDKEDAERVLKFLRARHTVSEDAA